jgi:stage V sporulation protein SpoVS
MKESTGCPQRGLSAAGALAAARSGHAQLSTQLRASIFHHALAVGITRGFLTASGIALASMVIAVITIRIRREDLAGTPEPAHDQPAPGPRRAGPFVTSAPGRTT